MRLAVLVRSALLGSTMLAAVAGCSSEPLPEDESETSAELNANDKTAFLFFVGKGLTKTQAAAVVGNLDQESSMNPKIKQIGGGPGRGIAQWSVNARWADENKFASSKGADPWALSTQLDFIWYELTQHSAYGLASLKKATSLTTAVQVFQDKYEICGKCAVGNRIKFAQAALNAYGNLAAPTGNDDPAESTPPGDCIVDGMAGDCISTTQCASNGGTSTPNLCPGAKNIQCCTGT